MAGAFTIGKRAYGLGRFVRVSREEIIESIVAELF
jgi:hypothetical protein